jgi:hypothetical protein
MRCVLFLPEGCPLGDEAPKHFDSIEMGKVNFEHLKSAATSTFEGMRNEEARRAYALRMKVIARLGVGVSGFGRGIPAFFEPSNNS